MLAALSLGLPELVAATKHKYVGKTYYIGGFAKLSEAHRKFMVGAGVGGYAADAFLAAVMEDDRILLRTQELQNIVAEEVEFVTMIPQYCWDRLAELFHDYEPSLIRSDCINTVTLTAAYMDEHVFRRTREEPFDLVRGDLHTNLKNLAQDPNPCKHPTKQRIKKLYQMGFNMDQLLTALTLLMHIPWTTVMLEQLHGQVAAFHRMHKQMHYRMLACRSFIRLCRPLLKQPQERLAIPTNSCS